MVGGSRGKRSARRRWAIIGIAAFLLVDFALVAWAFTSMTPASSPDPTQSRGLSLPKPAPAPTTPRVEPAETRTPEPAAIPPTRILAAVDANTAWRAPIGQCLGGTATAEVTFDGGATWKPSNVGGPTGAAAIVRILPQSTDLASMVTLAAEGCAPQFVRTFVAGDNWETFNEGMTSTWFVYPGDRAKLHGPQGDLAAPCPSVIDLAVRDSANAAVLCADHKVFITADAGASWGAPVSVAGAVAISAGAAGYVAAVTGQDSCAGVGIASLAAIPSEPVAATGCLSTTAPAPGTVALANGGDALWLWAGDELARSSDGGATWL